MKKLLSIFREFLWFSAGADLSIARKIRSERVILDSIGMSVVGTMLLAGLTSSYAAFYIFHKKSVAIGFGCLWAILIYSLDRYSVASIRKSGHFSQDLIVAIPRIILASIIAIIIVIPLELRIFEAEIDEMLPEYYVIQMKQYEATLDNSHIGHSINQLKNDLFSINQELEDLEKKGDTVLKSSVALELQSSAKLIKNSILGLRKEIAEAERRLAELKRSLVEEEEGLSESQMRGKGPYWRAKRAQIIEMENLILSKNKLLESLLHDQTDLNKKLSDIGQNERISELRAKRKIAEDNLQAAVKARKENIDLHYKNAVNNKNSSLLTRLKIVKKLSQDSTVDWTITLLRLLIFVFEISPIVLKLVSERGPYDAWRTAKAQLEIEKADNNHSILNKIKTVFVLEHTYEPPNNGKQDMKLIGVFSTEEITEQTISQLLQLPGFKNHYNYFCVKEYTLDQYYREKSLLTKTYLPEYSICSNDDESPKIEKIS